MQLDALLEVAIGTVFVWLVLSVATLEIQNFFTTQRGLRAENLEKAILDMFKNQKLVEKFYNHPLILELSPKDKQGKHKRPDNIPNPVFATAALEIILNAGKPGDMEDFFRGQCHGTRLQRPAVMGGGAGKR